MRKGRQTGGQECGTPKYGALSSVPEDRDGGRDVPFTIELRKERDQSTSLHEERADVCAAVRREHRAPSGNVHSDRASVAPSMYRGLRRPEPPIVDIPEALSIREAEDGLPRPCRSHPLGRSK